jgi:hypothetical protein
VHTFTARAMASPEYKVPTPDDRVAIICLHCDRQQEVSRKAMSVTCKFCSKRLRLEDLKIKQYEARRVIETCGIVTVEKKGNVVTDRIDCGSLLVKGKVKGEVNSRGTVVLEADAEIKGDITAASLVIGPGAMIEGKLEIRPRAAEAPATPGESPAPTAPATGAAPTPAPPENQPAPAAPPAARPSPARPASHPSLRGKVVGAVATKR